jgi:hypothetical protein
LKNLSISEISENDLSNNYTVLDDTQVGYTLPLTIKQKSTTIDEENRIALTVISVLQKPLMENATYIGAIQTAYHIL